MRRIVMRAFSLVFTRRIEANLSSIPGESTCQSGADPASFARKSANEVARKKKAVPTRVNVSFIPAHFKVPVLARSMRGRTFLPLGGPVGMLGLEHGGKK